MNVRSAARLALPFVGAVLLPLAAVTLFTPFYQTNDDVTMRLLAEGHFVPGGKPVPFLLFINVVIGKLLAMAYTRLPGVPWYDLVLGASLIAAAAALLVVWIGPGGRREILWTAIFDLFFLRPAFVSVQYTIVSLTCAAAGVALVVRAAAEPLPPRPRTLHAIFGVALFVWGSLIRFEGAALMAIEGALLALPLALVALRGPAARPRWRALLLSACAAVVFMVAFYGIDRFAYSRERGWSDFHEFETLRRRGAENLVPEQLTPTVLARLRAETGWSENDFLLFSGWYFTDPAVYSVSNVRKSAALFGDQVWTSVRFNSGMGDARTFLVTMRWAFVLLGALAIARGASSRLILYVLGTTLTIVLLDLFVSVMQKPSPARIFWPMLILAATMLTIAARRGENVPRFWQTAAAVVLAILVTGRSLQALHRTSESHRQATANAQIDAAELRRTDARLFIIHGNAFPYEDYWQPLHPTPPPFPFIGLGAADQTPPVQDALRSMAGTDVAWSLCSDPRLILIAWQPIPPMLSRYVFEHHNTMVRFEPLLRREEMSAWRCRRE
jgi:hypothetical protein